MPRLSDKIRSLFGAAGGVEPPGESAAHGSAHARARQIEAEIRSIIDKLRSHIKSGKDAVAFLDQAAPAVEALGGAKLAVYEAAFAAFPDHDPICLKLADLYESVLACTPEACNVFHLAMSLHPRQTGSRLRYALGLARAGRQEEAVPEFRRVITDLDNPAFHAADPPRAIKSIRAAAAMGLAEALAHLGQQGPDAIAAYREALLADPRRVDLVAALGKAYASAGETTSEALLAMTAAAEARPDDPEVVLGLARVEKARGNPAGARRWLHRLLQLVPDDAALKDRVRQMGFDPAALGEEADLSTDFQNDVQTGKALDDLSVSVVEAADPFRDVPPAVAATADAPAPPATLETGFEAFQRSQQEEGGAQGRHGALSTAALERILKHVVQTGDASAPSLRYLREGIAREPRNLLWRAALVRACLRNHDAGPAFREALHLLRQSGDDAGALELAARALAELSARPAEAAPAAAELRALGAAAVGLVRRALQFAPQSPFLIHEAALVFARQMQTTEADLALCERALAQGAFDFEIAHFLARIYEQARLTDKRFALLWAAFQAPAPPAATQADDERLAAQTDYRDDLLEALAYELFRRGVADDKAARVYCELLSQRPGHPELTLFVARRYRDNERMLNELSFAFRTAAELAPSDRALALTAAKLAVRHDDVFAAQQLLHPLLDATPAKAGADGVSLEHVLRLLRTALDASTRIAEGLTTKLERLYLDQPDNSWAAICLGLAYAVEGRIDAVALTVYEQASASRPDDLRFRIMIAQCFRELGDETQALAAYREVLAEAPRDPSTVAQMARFCSLALAGSLTRGRRTPAEERLFQQTFQIVEKALARHPQNPDVRLAYARVLHGAGRADEAIERIRDLAAQHPDFRPRLIACLRELQRAAPGQTAGAPGAARLLLVDLLIEERQLAEALEVARELYGLSSAPIGDLIGCLDRIGAATSNLPSGAINADEIAMEKAVLLKSVGMFQESLEALRAVARARPDDENVQIEYQEVLEILNHSAKSEELRLELARHYLGTRQIAKAITFLQKQIETSPSTPSYRRYLGTAYIRVGHLDLAQRELARLEIDEPLKPILYDLANEFARLRQYGAAIETIERLIAVSPEYGDAVRLRDLWVAQQARLTTGTMVVALDGGLDETARRRYELLELLGRGANGEVYKAFDHEFDEVVALKILPEEYQFDPAVLDRFRFEAKAARRLTHRNIVRIYDIGEEEGRKYISMEFVDGATLERRLAQDPTPPVGDVLRIAYQIAQALGHAHAEGIVHRDVKPANVLLTRQSVAKLTDFGVAALRSGAPTPPGAGASACPDARASGIVGTPLYMSPEQVRSQPADARSDIYSLGIMLYEMLAGGPPFTTGNIAWAHVHEDPKLPPTPYKDVASIAMKCIRKNPGERFQSAAELIKALREAAADYGVSFEEA